MKKNIYRSLLTILALFLCIGLGSILLLYSKPMKDFSLNLSLMLEDGADPESFDSKGWSVYTQEGDLVTYLEPHGYGAYEGIEPGQTFYYSRTLNEQLDTPTLQIGVVNRNISVWLDNHLIYTDCSELDNQIGMLTLPMHEWDRDEPVTISLPPDYYGKTLTIAQSTPEYVEGGALRAYPCDVMLYCGYAYESKLISESYTTAIFAAASFITGAILLFIMIYLTDISFFFLSVIPFLWMASLLTKTSFFFTYFGKQYNSLSSGITLISSAALLIFLALRAGKYRAITWGILIAYLASVVVYYQQILKHNGFSVIGEPFSSVVLKLPYWLALAAFFSIVILCILLWRKENSFYQTFSLVEPLFILGFWIILFLMDSRETFKQLMLSLGSQDMTYIHYRIFWATVFATLVTGIIDGLKTEIEQRIEKQMLEEHREMTLQSYENLHRQHQEIMMLRHDMAKHFSTLKTMSTDTQVTSYLEELIGQNEKIPTIVQTGNQVFDIILNSKLSFASDKGLAIDIVNVSAPEKLPLSDADLCSLIMNILDNAITAAANSPTEAPFIQIDIHEKNGYFTMTCKNSASTISALKKPKKETVQRHGFGLKIIRSITERYHGLVSAEHNQNCYEVKVVIPLS